MMKNLSKLALALFCAILLASITEVQAQKKPKLKGLAKEILGEWVADDVDFKFDKSKLDALMQNNLAVMEKDMAGKTKGKLYLKFNADGTFIFTAIQRSMRDKKGTWTIEGNQIKLKPESDRDEMLDKALLYITDRKMHLEQPMEGAPITLNTITKFIKK